MDKITRRISELDDEARRVQDEEVLCSTEALKQRERLHAIAKERKALVALKNRGG